MKLWLLTLCAVSFSLAAQTFEDPERQCVYDRSVKGLPIYEAHGMTGYSRNLCTGKLKLANEEIAKINEQVRAMWRRRGYVCALDCSGHEAGYKWAEKEEITQAFECDGSSRSFIEGCEAYVKLNKPR